MSENLSVRIQGGGADEEAQSRHVVAEDMRGSIPTNRPSSMNPWHKREGTDASRIEERVSSECTDHRLKRVASLSRLSTLDISPAFLLSNQ